MATLRCTQKLLRQLRTLPPAGDVAATNLLGDWYANALNIGRMRLVLCVSERSLLPVLLPAREYRTLPVRLFPEIAWMLGQIGVSPNAAAAELAAMDPIAIGRTKSRIVLGSMNGMIIEAYDHLAGARSVPDLRATSLRLSTSIYSQLGHRNHDYGSPQEATMRLLG